jgi:hypothetical protein
MQNTEILEIIKTLNLTETDRNKILGLRISLNNRTRGWARRSGFSVPMWAWDRGNNYFTYYICHELSHILAKGFKHDVYFYNKFKKICPTYLWIYEHEYLPTKWKKYLNNKGSYK